MNLCQLFFLVLFGMTGIGLVLNIARPILRAIRENAEAAEKQAAAERAAAEKRQAQAAKAAKAAQEQAAREAQRQQKAAEREQKAAAAHALKVARAQELAALAERALEAKKAFAALDAPAQRPETISPAETVPAKPEAAPEAAPQKEPATALTLEQFARQTAPKPFQGQKVAFTGKLSGMTRAQAIELVEQAGGHGYSKGMPVGTTLLVVGTLKNGGNSQKLDKADEWIGQVRKITEAQFLDMLTA